MPSLVGSEMCIRDRAYIDRQTPKHLPTANINGSTDRKTRNHLPTARTPLLRACLKFPGPDAASSTAFLKHQSVYRPQTPKSLPTDKHQSVRIHRPDPLLWACLKAPRPGTAFSTAFNHETSIYRPQTRTHPPTANTKACTKKTRKQSNLRVPTEKHQTISCLLYTSPSPRD